MPARWASRSMAWGNVRFSELQESKNRAARAAGETLEYLLDRIDVEARPRILVERAQPHQFPPLGMQGEMLGDDFNYVAGLLNSADQVIIESCRHVNSKRSVKKYDNAVTLGREIHPRKPRNRQRLQGNISPGKQTLKYSPELVESQAR